MVAMKRCWLTMTEATSWNRFTDEVQALLRLAPHRVERIVPQEKICDTVVHAEAGVGQAPRLNRSAKSSTHEIDRGPDRLSPGRGESRPRVDIRSRGDKAVLVDEVAGEFSKSVALAVTVKGWTEDDAEKGKWGGLAHPMLHPYLRHATSHQAI